MNGKEKLLELYAEVPAPPPCAEGCFKCCGPVILLPIEAEILGVEGCVTPFDPDTLKCKLNVDGKCSVYNDRPFTCRIFNSTNCAPFVCPEIPEHGRLKDHEVASLMNRYFDILNGSPEEDIVAMMEAIEKYGESMAEHDFRNGWIKEIDKENKL